MAESPPAQVTTERERPPQRRPPPRPAFGLALSSTSAPMPCRLIFLSDLPRMAAGTKVRFLGCVSEYHVSSATLLLHHDHPACMPSLQPPRRQAPSCHFHAPAVAETETRTTTTTTTIMASVDVRLLLNTLQAPQIAVGEWLNVIGYVGAAEARSPSEQRSSTLPPPLSSLSSPSSMAASASTTKTGAWHQPWEENQGASQLLQKNVRLGKDEGKDGEAQRQLSDRQTEAAIVYVQAVMLWSAGAIQLAEYERILAERQEVEQTLAVK